MTTGPSSTSCQSGRAAATPASSARSIRSSMTPKKPSRGCGMCAWSAGSGCDDARLREVGDVDAAREGVDVRVAVALGLVQRLAAGEDDVGRWQQLLLRARCSAGGAPANADSSSMQS